MGKVSSKNIKESILEPIISENDRSEHYSDSYRPNLPPQMLKLKEIVEENPRILFLLNQNQAIVAAYAANLFVFPSLNAQGNQRVDDIIAGAISIGILSASNFVLELVANCKHNKVLEHHLRIFRNTTLNISIILSAINTLATLFKELPAAEQDSLTNAVITASDWLEDIGYWRALVLSVPVCSVFLAAGLLNRFYKIDNKNWARMVSHVGSVIINTLAMYTFASLPLGFAQDFNPEWISPSLTKNLPIILASIQLLLSAMPDELELKSNAFLKYSSRIKRSFDSVSISVKLACFNFMAINNIISFIALKFEHLEYPNPIAYSLLNSCALIAIQLGYLIFRLKSAANEQPNDNFLALNHAKNLVTVFSYEWSKALFARQTLLNGLSPWFLLPAITSTITATVAREKNWIYLKHLNSYFFDAGLIASCGELSTYGAAAIAPIIATSFIINAALDTFQARHQRPLIDAFRSTVRAGLTGYVVGTKFFPSSWPEYSPWIAAAGIVVVNSGEILIQKIAEKKNRNDDSMLLDHHNAVWRDSSRQQFHKANSPAHLSLSILLVTFLSAYEAFSAENSKNTWPEQLMSLLLLSVVSAMLASALIKKPLASFIQFFRPVETHSPKVPEFITTAVDNCKLRLCNS